MSNSGHPSATFASNNRFPFWQLLTVIFIGVFLANVTSCYTVQYIEQVRKERASVQAEKQFWQDLRDKHGSSDTTPNVRTLPGTPYR